MRQIFVAITVAVGLAQVLMLGLPTPLSAAEADANGTSLAWQLGTTNLPSSADLATVGSALPRLQISDTFTITQISGTIPIPTLSAPIGLISPTVSSDEPVATSTPPTEEAVPPTATPAPSPTPSPTPAGVAADAVAAPASLEGTILANRTDANVQFFLEGNTYSLAPQRSTGLSLPRVTSVLNLYTCEATQPQEDCFWDPFLLDRDGFYEVIYGSEIGRASFLTLREAGAPPTDQIWVQNRSDQVEAVVYKSQVFEITPSAVQQFTVADDDVPTFFLRSCIGLGEELSCEWTPAVADPGFYYALEVIETAGGLPGSRLSMLQMNPIISGDGATVGAPKQVLCQLNVPTINVRSGPGLEYLIVAKIRGTESEAATVLVSGTDATGEWLAVDERVASGGWVTASTNYLLCDDEVSGLPVAETTDGRLAPTPEPVTVAAAEPAPAPEPEVIGDDASEPGSETAAGEESAAEETGEADEAAAPPEGLAMLVINNSFEQEVRFTLDQQYRVEPGPSEYDLSSGDSVTLLIFPGQIPFSVSSAWRGLSDNAEFFLDADETRSLWLYFIPDPDGSGRWILQF